MLLSSLLGDITQKGYEKKRAKLLASYISHLPSKTSSSSALGIFSCCIKAFLLLFLHLCFFFSASPVSNVIVVQAEKQNEARLHKKIPQIYI